MVPISHSFDQDGPHLIEGHLTSFGNSIVDGKDVVTINTNGKHAVSRTTTSNAIASVLLFGRG